MPVDTIDRFADLIFVAKLTGRATDSNDAYRYAWVEQQVTTAGGYEDAATARYGTTAVNYARELNAKAVDVTGNPIVWMRFRCLRDGTPIYEFESGDRASSVARVTSQTVNADGTYQGILTTWNATGSTWDDGATIRIKASSDQQLENGKRYEVTYQSNTSDGVQVWATDRVITTMAKVTNGSVDGSGNYPAILTWWNGSTWTESGVISIKAPNGETLANNTRYQVIHQTGSVWCCDKVGGGGGSITVKERDSSPTVSGVTTLVFDQRDGFVVTDNGSGEAEVDMDDATPTRWGVVNAVTANGQPGDDGLQDFGGSKLFVGELATVATGYGGGSASFILGTPNDATRGNHNRIEYDASLGPTGTTLTGTFYALDSPGSITFICNEVIGMMPPRQYQRTESFSNGTTDGRIITTVSANNTGIRLNGTGGYIQLESTFSQVVVPTSHVRLDLNDGFGVNGDYLSIVIGPTAFNGAHTVQTIIGLDGNGRAGFTGVNPSGMRFRAGWCVDGGTGATGVVG